MRSRAELEQLVEGLGDARDRVIGTLMLELVDRLSVMGANQEYNMKKLLDKVERIAWRVSP